MFGSSKIFCTAQEPGANASEIFAVLKHVRPGDDFVPNFEMFAKSDVSTDRVLSVHLGNTEHVIWRSMARTRIPSTHSSRAGARPWGRSSRPPTNCIMILTIRTISGDNDKNCKLGLKLCKYQIHTHYTQIHKLQLGQAMFFPLQSTPKNTRQQFWYSLLDNVFIYWAWGHRKNICCIEIFGNSFRFQAKEMILASKFYHKSKS